MIIVIILGCSVLSAIMPATWTQFQKEIGNQAAQFKDSVSHQQIRNNRDTRHYNVGDAETYWRWNLSIMPPGWIQTAATCRAVGEHCYVFVANSDWNTHMTQANVDSVLVRLEQNTPNNPAQGAITMDVNLFGPIPDELDNDPKLIVFYSALGSFQGTSFDGYFSPYNQVTESEAQQMNPSGHSNQCEMIYMTCYPLGPVAPIRLSVLSHELEHLIHWGQDANEESWLDEGCAELAMVAYGIPDPISSFPNNPDNSLTLWDQQTADYVKVMLFFTYLKEHYDATGLISDLVADPLNGMPALVNQLAVHYPELTLGQLLSNWTAANVIDAPQPFDGLYDYAELDLPTFAMTNMNTYPTQSSQPVSGYAADYLKYVLPAGTATFHIVGNSSITVRLLLFNAMNECVDVIDNNVGPFDGSIPEGTHHAVFVVTNISAVGVEYSYSIASVGNTDAISTNLRTGMINCYPNPFSTSTRIKYSLAKTGSATLKIYNLKGEMVKCVVDEFKSQGDYAVSWTGEGENGEKLPSGIYFCKLRTAENAIVHRMMFLK